MGYDKKKLAEYLRCVFKHTIEDHVDPNKHRRFKLIGGAGTKISIKSSGQTFEGQVGNEGGPTLTIIDDGMDAHDLFIAEVLKDEEFCDLVGPAPIEKTISNILQATNGNAPDDLENLVRHNILKPLRDEIREWTSYVPVVNLRLEERFSIGNAEFINLDDAKRECADFIKDHTFMEDDEEKRSKQREGLLNQFGHALQLGSSVIKVAVRAHASRAQDTAAAKALQIINILRAHTHLLYSRSQRALIGLPTELHAGHWGAISFSQDSSRTFHLNTKPTGPLLPFELNKSNIEHLEHHCHFKTIDDILKNDVSEWSRLEQVIVQAFQALGATIVAPTPDARFLGCMIAIERMVIKDREESTAEKVSDRVAVALATKPEYRDSIIRQVKKLYNIRSRIVHAAFVGAGEDDAAKLEMWALALIQAAIKSHSTMQSHAEFCDCLDPRKLGLSTAANELQLNG